MIKIAVFGSGNGSNFQAIAEYFQGKDVEFTCISDKKDAFILERAKRLGIKYLHVPYKETFQYLQANKYDLVVLAGYMRILPENVVNLAKFINIHPSLLPSFKGKDVIEAAYNSGVKVTGVSVHYVNEEVDSGEIIAQVPVIIKEKMTLDELETEIHRIEHKLYPLVIDNIIFNKEINIDCSVRFSVT
jgi:phosphoribosylglycinamide formyltransferase-1